MAKSLAKNLSVFISTSLVVASAFAAIQTPKEIIQERHNAKLCNSAEEYISTLEFLRKLSYVQVPEAGAREVADVVSRSCSGAAARFQRTFELLKKMGVSYKKSLQLALEFAKEKKEVQENFFEVLKLSYVKEMFDFDFQMALDVAYQFSIHLKSHHEQARQDFVRLAEFCSSNKESGLPLRTCAQLSVKVAQLSPYFTEGVYPPFKSLTDKLRNEEKFSLPMKTAFEIAVKVLKYGDKAPENFLKGFEYASSDKGLNLPAKDALAFAIEMSKRSTPSYPPPLVDLEVE